MTSDLPARAATEAAPAPILQAEGLSKSFQRGPETVHAIQSVSLVIGAGEVVGLIGPSGSGKTTLLNVLCGWERADEGTIRWRGTPIHSPASLAWRDVAVMPQDLALIEEFSIQENVRLPLRLSNGEDPGDSLRFDELLADLGLGDIGPRMPAETSLGEQQRASLARGLVVAPSLLLADEPIGHQDEAWAKRVMRTIRTASGEGTACLIATHNPEVFAFIDRLFAIRDGELIEEPVPTVRSGDDRNG